MGRLGPLTVWFIFEILEMLTKPNYCVHNIEETLAELELELTKNVGAFGSTIFPKQEVTDFQDFPIFFVIHLDFRNFDRLVSKNC